jgi:hypothetical protein
VLSRDIAGGDPVASGLVANLNRLGANVPGIANMHSSVATSLSPSIYRRRTSFRLGISAGNCSAKRIS